MKLAINLFLSTIFIILITACSSESDQPSVDNGEVVDLGVASHEQQVLVHAPGWGDMKFDTPIPGTYELPAFGLAADGNVLTEDNEAKKLSDFYGDKFVILSFIYTQCSDLNGCPLVTAVFYKIKQRLEEMPELADQLRMVSLSFDPVYDTPEVMKFYGQGSKGWGAGEWEFLTTSSVEELTPITEGFGQYVNKEYDDEGNPTSSFAHILRVFLIDKEGKKRAQYSASFLHEESLISDLKTLLMEEMNSKEAG